MFKIEDIPTFDRRDLNGKDLKIIVYSETLNGVETSCVAGYEESTGITYMIDVRTVHKDGK